MRTVNNSRRPISMRKAQKSFAELDRCAKLLTGLTDPIAGPIFPNEDAEAPNAETKSKSKNVKITEETTKISM